MIDQDKLRKLDEAATPWNIEVRQHTKANADAKNKALDRVKLSNQIGPLGGFERADGELLAALWNNRTAILAMAEEHGRMRADAARYRWLRDHSCPPHNFYISVPDEFSGVRYGPSEVDAYIDAARLALGEEKS